MNIVPEIAALDTEMRGWRHRLHAHPETAFEETVTSAFVADTLRSFGLDVHKDRGRASWALSATVVRAPPLVCAPISTRCTFMRRRECRMRRR
jgi:metal-dependent amidase/aminoacylase/carboxypeptidase family protein